MTQPYAGPPKSRPGQMTAVMRALPQATGPKVLRIGLVQAGRVVEERVIKQRTHVTVGTNERCTFVINAPGVPSTFRLFELVAADKKKGEYHLNFLEGMTGRVALKTGISDLGALRTQAKRGPQGAYQVALSDDARGKVVVGDVTFLFQFVAPPPVQPKPQLPVSVQSGLSSQIDWRFTIIASFSFLFHFGAVGMLYSDWMDPMVSEEVAIAGLVDSIRTLPPPPVETPDTTEPTTEGNTEVAEAPKAGSSAGKGGPSSGAGKSGGAGSMSAGQFNALSNELDQLEMATLGALSGQGSATAGVLGSGEIPTGALENAAASGAGVGANGGSGLNLGGGGGGAITPGATGGDGLSGIAKTGGGGPATAGTATKVEGPKLSVGASASVAGGSVNNASRVVAGLRAGFRRCYTQGLSANPEMSGSVRVTARIGEQGEVLSVSASPSGSISGAVASCIAGRVRGAQFDKPEGGAATIVIPVTLVQQK